MSDFNHLGLQGRIVKNAKVRIVKTASGERRVADFAIVTNRSKKNADGSYEDIGSFFNLSVFINSEKIEKYLVKGQQVLIEGYLKQDRWEQDGKKRSAVNIAVNELHIVWPQKMTTSETADSEKIIYDETDSQDEDIFIGEGAEEVF